MEKIIKFASKKEIKAENLSKDNYENEIAVIADEMLRFERVRERKTLITSAEEKRTQLFSRSMTPIQLSANNSAGIGFQKEAVEKYGKKHFD